MPASKDTLFVLTYARAGLGHLRVTSALLEGFPGRNKPLVFSSLDKATSSLHRFTSIHPLARQIGEWVQRGLLEDIFTYLYTRYIRARAKKLAPQLETIVNQHRISIRRASPQRLAATHGGRVYFICTHFGLAHQIGELKSSLADKTGVDVKLAVVVTDDSPQHAWFVPEADITFVPSQTTRDGLLKYARGARASIQIQSYPLSLKLGQTLGSKKYKYKLAQGELDSTKKIKVMLPVSGAAVGLDYSRIIALELLKLSNRFYFNVVSRRTTFTFPYLRTMTFKKGVSVYAFGYERDVVVFYNKILRKETIGYEITKPSEQAFKALFSPKQVGGVILLFTHPVGRQEYDNLWFLARHKLIPTKEEQEKLWQLAIDQKPITKNLKLKANKWRGVRLLSDPKLSAQFTYWCLGQGIFEEMMKYKAALSDEDRHVDARSPSLRSGASGRELGWDGVSRIWALLTSGS